MIRKFQQGDTERVMQIWLEGNIETHDFIAKDYWVSNYPLVKKLEMPYPMVSWQSCSFLDYHLQRYMPRSVMGSGVDLVCPST